MSLSLEMHRRIQELSPEARRLYHLEAEKAGRLLKQWVAKLEEALQKAENYDNKK